MPILDELKKKANGKADRANNIEEAIALMDFSEGGGGESTHLLTNLNWHLPNT